MRNVCPEGQDLQTASRSRRATKTYRASFKTEWMINPLLLEGSGYFDYKNL